MPAKSRKAKLWQYAIGWAIIGLWVYLPLPLSKPLICVEAERRLQPHSGVTERTFKIRAAPRFYVRTYTKTAGQSIFIDLIRNDGFQLLKGWPVRPGASEFQVGIDLPPGLYTLRVDERNTTGRYKIEVFDKQPVTHWQRFISFLALLFLISGTVYALQLRKHRHEPSPVQSVLGAQWIFIIVSLSVFLLTLYLLLHEGGHALAMIWFGDFDWARSDFFGLWGSPHASRKLDNPPLEGWQDAIISIAGPLFPSVAGYFLFLTSRLRRFRDFRLARPVFNLFCLTSIFICLFPHIGLIMSMSGLVVDNDYSGFMRGMPAPAWLANTGLILVLILNSWIIFLILKESGQALAKLKQAFKAGLQPH